MPPNYIKRSMKHIHQNIHQITRIHGPKQAKIKQQISFYGPPIVLTLSSPLLLVCFSSPKGLHLLKGKTTFLPWSLIKHDQNKKIGFQSRQYNKHQCFFCFFFLPLFNYFTTKIWSLKGTWDHTLPVCATTLGWDELSWS